MLYGCIESINNKVTIVCASVESVTMWLLFNFSTSSKTLNLIDILEKIADNSVKATGFFHSGPELHCIQLHPHPE